ncbi:MAG: carboxypeptidase regulatory-like domain-containing protein, partial [Blastocatellia bacterium]|nr:carboxypeptidase regulatory-like domain-containing protein [Blastocatellia bacterium]
MAKLKLNLFLAKSAVFLLLIAAAVGYGQTPTATLSGVVRNEQGEVIKDATVSVKNNATGIARQVTTDKDGRYVFAFLD